MEKRLCFSCKSENLAEAQFCSSCGTSLQPLKNSKCSQCGREVNGQENFCPSCGTKLKRAVEVADFHKIPRTAPWVALGLVAAGLVFIFVFVSSQSRPPVPSNGSPPSSTSSAAGGAALPTLSEAEIARLPKDFKKLVEQGNHYFDHQQFHDAMVLYKKALEINGDDLDLRTDYAACLNFLGEFEGAKRELEKVLTQNPNHLVATFNLGVVHLKLGQNELARKYWNKYLELDPSSPRAAAVKEMLAGFK